MIENRKQSSKKQLLKKRLLCKATIAALLVCMLNTQAMDIAEEEKSPETPVLSSPILAPVHNHNHEQTSKKKLRHAFGLEQELGNAILRQDTKTITDFIKNGTPIDKQFRCWVTQRNGKKKLSLSRPLTFALSYANKNNFNSVKVLLELGADIQFAKPPHFFTNKTENVKRAEQLYSELQSDS